MQVRNSTAFANALAWAVRETETRSINTHNKEIN